MNIAIKYIKKMKINVAINTVVSTHRQWRIQRQWDTKNCT